MLLILLFIFLNIPSITPESVVEKSYKLTEPYYDMSHASNVNILSRIGMNIKTYYNNPPLSCINTVTYLFDEQNTCSSCEDFVKNPENWNFRETTTPKVGDVVIYFKDNKAFHAALIVKVNKNGILINHAVKKKYLKNRVLPKGNYKYYTYNYEL